MKRTLAAALGLLLFPLPALAAPMSPAGANAAMAACAGKREGDAVQLPGKKRGRMIAAVCQDVRGQLIAVPTVKQ